MKRKLTTLSLQVPEDRASRLIHLPEAVAKNRKATNILRPAIDVTFDKDAESEVFSEVGVPEVRFFFSFFRHPRVGKSSKVRT